MVDGYFAYFQVTKLNHSISSLNISILPVFLFPTRRFLPRPRFMARSACFGAGEGLKGKYVSVSELGVMLPRKTLISISLK